MDPYAMSTRWLWRVYNQGWPDDHEDSTNAWGEWSLISAEDAERLAKEDITKKRYEFVRYLPSSPISVACEHFQSGPFCMFCGITMPWNNESLDL